MAAQGKGGRIVNCATTGLAGHRSAFASRAIWPARCFFATPAARYVTNQTLAVDAGFSIS